MNKTNKTIPFYKSKPVTTPLCKDNTQRLMLFIHHDDPKYNNLSFLLHPRKDKPSLPEVFHRNIKTAKPKQKMALNKTNRDNKDKAQQQSIIKPQSYINLNTELINNMKMEMTQIKTAGNETPSDSHVITKTISTFYQNKLTFSSDKMNNIEKIKEMNPKLGKQILKTQSCIPFTYKKMNKKFKALFDDTLTNTFYEARYHREKINLDEILIHHNSIVRKDPTPFLVKNYNLKRSLYLMRNNWNSNLANNKFPMYNSSNRKTHLSSSQISSNIITIENIH